MKRFIEDLKKDKKKAAIAIGALVLLFLTIVFTFFNGKDTEAENEKQLEGVVVPVDSSKVEEYGVNQHQNDEFFNIDNEEQTDEITNNFLSVNTENKQTTNVSSSPSRNSKTTGGGYVNPYAKPAYIDNNYQSNKKPSVAEEVFKVDDSRRRRVPNDASGNMGSSTAGSSNSLYNCVMFNNSRAIRNGSYVTMRTVEPIKVDGEIVARNTVISGVASLNDERMQIIITSIKIGSQIKKVKWTIYDQDANLGVAIPQNILTDISQDAADEALSTEGSKVDVSVPVVGNVKVNLKKRNKDLSFIVPDGHKLFLKVL